MRLCLASVPLLALLVGAVLLGGCGKQQEGQVCDKKNSNDDCESGLECTASEALLNTPSDTERCCPPAGSKITDSRCRRSVGATGTGGTGGGAGMTGGAAGTGGDAAGCNNDLDCHEGQRCGVLNQCVPECQNSSECTPPEVCGTVSRVCGSSTPGAGGTVAETGGTPSAGPATGGEAGSSPSVPSNGGTDSNP